MEEVQPVPDDGELAKSRAAARSDRTGTCMEPRSSAKHMYDTPNTVMYSCVPLSRRRILRQATGGKKGEIDPRNSSNVQLETEKQASKESHASHLRLTPDTYICHHGGHDESTTELATR